MTEGLGIDVPEAPWIPKDPRMSTRHALIAAVVGLAALGATCKGKEARRENPARADSRAVDSAPAAQTGERPLAVAEIEGVDITAVEPRRRAELMRLLNDTYCYCGCPRTLAACLANRAECGCVRCAERMTTFIIHEFRDGVPTEDVEAQLLGGFSEGYNGRAREMDLADHATRGPADAQYTLAEFADFRCPHCAAAAEILEELLGKRKDARLVYFYFPLGSGGDRSVRAAEAAEEARAQGKFWELARILFKNQHALEDQDLERYAEDIGLDLTRFRAALKARTHRDRVMADKRLGESFQVQSTPTFFINGRPFGLARTAENFEMRFQMESERGRCD